MELIILSFIKDFIKGLAIGAGAILPGISSGVLCVIFGIYEKLLNCILNFFKNIRDNFKVLFPIGLGTICGIVLFGNILKYVFYAYPIQTKFIFIGLILGSIPALLKKACNKQTFKFHYLIYLIISFLFGLCLVILEHNIDNTSSQNDYSYFYIVFSGFLMSTGVIVPGISSTLILMLLGIYDAYLISVSTLYFPFLIPLAIGLAIGSYFCMKLIKFLFDKFHTPTFFCIIGFTLGSIFVLMPSISFDIDGLTGLLCFIIALCAGTLF